MARVQGKAALVLRRRRMAISEASARGPEKWAHNGSRATYVSRKADFAGAHVARRLGPLVRGRQAAGVRAHLRRVEERGAEAFAVDAVVLNVALDHTRREAGHTRR